MIIINNFIKYYYGFDNFTISYDLNRYIIKYNDNLYYLYIVYDLDEVVNLYNLSCNLCLYSNFIVNMDNSIISEYNGSYYVLLDDTGFSSNNGSLFNNYVVDNNYSFNWRRLWIIKSDFIEGYYLNIKGKYSVVDESFDYYLWLLEYAIYYLIDYDNYIGRGYIMHNNFNNISTFNPLDIRIDIKERDLGEYFKYIFFNDSYKNINLHEFIFYLYKNHNYNFELVFARVLYPNYYFDTLDDVFLDKIGDKDLLIYINRIKEFEEYLKMLYSEFSFYYKIKNVDWF